MNSGWSFRAGTRAEHQVYSSHPPCSDNWSSAGSVAPLVTTASGKGGLSLLRPCLLRLLGHKFLRHIAEDDFGAVRHGLLIYDPVSSIGAGLHLRKQNVAGFSEHRFGKCAVLLEENDLTAPGFAAAALGPGQQQALPASRRELRCRAGLTLSAEASGGFESVVRQVQARQAGCSGAVRSSPRRTRGCPGCPVRPRGTGLSRRGMAGSRQRAWAGTRCCWPPARRKWWAVRRRAVSCIATCGSRSSTRPNYSPGGQWRRRDRCGRPLPARGGLISCSASQARRTGS